MLMMRPRIASGTESCNSASAPVLQTSKQAPSAAMASAASPRLRDSIKPDTAAINPRNPHRMVAGEARATPPWASHKRRDRRPDAGAREQRGQAADAGAQRPVGESRRHLPDRAIEAVAEQQQQQDDLDAAMSPDGGDAVENVAREMLRDRALLPISGRRAHAPRR